MFTLKQINEKAQEKKCRLYVGFMDLEMAYEGSIGRHYGKYFESMMWGVNC